MRSRNIFIFAVILIISIPAMIASGFSPTTEWWRPLRTDDGQSSVFIDEMSANFGATFAVTKTYAAGDARATLTGDMDHDDEIELLYINPVSQYVRFLTVGESSVTLENEFDLGGRINATSILGNIDSDVYYEIASIVNNTNLTVYSYNGTNIIVQCNLAIPGGIATWPALLDGDTIIVGNSTNGLQYMVLRFAGSDVCYLESAQKITASTVAFNNIFNRFRIAPLTKDLDGDGEDDVVMACDIDNDGNEGICVLDSGNFNPGWFGGGYYDDLGGAIGAKIAGFTAENMDGTGESEICVTYYGTSGGAANDAFLTCFELDRNPYLNTYVYNVAAGTTVLSNPVMIDINRDDYNDLCVVGSIGGPASFISCYSMHNKTEERILYYDIGATTVLSSGTQISGADLNNDGVGDIVAASYLFYIDGGTVVGSVYDTISTSAISSISDVDNDGFLDIMRQWTNNIRIDSSNATNLPPTINSSLAYGGFLGWYDSPVCINTTITFNAYDNSVYAYSNYWNDIPIEYERIRSDCGGLIAETYGDYDGSNPIFSCFFNRTGIYPVFLCLEDGSNVDYTGACNAIPIMVSVIQGVSGTTCNLPSEYIDTYQEIVDLGTTPSTTYSQTQGEAIEETIDYITYGSVRLKFIIGAVFMILILGGIASLGIQNALVYAIIAVLCTIGNVMLTLWPVYVLLIVAIMMLLVLLIGKFIASGSNGG